MNLWPSARHAYVLDQRTREQIPFSVRNIKQTRDRNRHLIYLSLATAGAHHDDTGSRKTIVLKRTAYKAMS